MPASINIKAPGLSEFTSKLDAYSKLTKKMPWQIVAEKSNDLRIQAYKQFESHSWKEGRKGGAQDYGQLRHAGGEGTHVRQSIRDNVRDGVAYDFTKKRRKRKGASRPVDKNGTNLSGQRLAVWLELKARARGVNYLAASLLDRRYKKPKKNEPTPERRLVANLNKKGQTMAVLELTPGQYKIEMFGTGAAIVDRRYNVADKAIGAVAADMDVYLVRQANKAAQAALSRYRTA
jgi:hypothetical protein